MRRSADIAWFAAAFVVLSGALGWALWRVTSSAQLVPMRDSMMAVPAVCAMIAARGFGWARKAAYAAVAMGGYVSAGALATATGFHAQVAQQLAAGGQPSVGATLYLAFLTTFPFVVLLLFVGRKPSLLWSAQG